MHSNNPISGSDTHGRLLFGVLLSMLFLLPGCAEESGEPEEHASPLRVRLMTEQQYTNTISQVFGRDIGDSVAPPLPPLMRTDGLLASGAMAVGVTSDQIQQIQQAASFIAAKVVDEEHRDFLIPCTPESVTQSDIACATQFIDAAGRLLYRRPVEPTRVDELARVAAEAADQTEDFYSGLAIALEAMLFSPDVVFIIDSAEPDPNRPGHERLNAFSLASRLSFFLWNSAHFEHTVLITESGPEILTQVPGSLIRSFPRARSPR